MLVLSRKLNERIVINGDIVVTVVKIDRNQVRIGIEAPGHIPVFREEILPAIQHAPDESTRWRSARNRRIPALVPTFYSTKPRRDG